MRRLSVARVVLSHAGRTLCSYRQRRVTLVDACECKVGVGGTSLIRIEKEEKPQNENASLKPFQTLSPGVLDRHSGFVQQPLAHITRKREAAAVLVP